MLCPTTDLRVRRFSPKFFEKDISNGIPTITAEGRKALEEELQEESEHKLEAATPRLERPDPTPKAA